ncbi:MAG TPA: efflux RND transporter permease subunit [Saprospiraceae bacterium]|nr:efflux RND transporter permease subunit [Saprospiraceae bacterium]HMQ81670.1 efflux RND transporter permease subunit [Saprospiraceae bacterium]
MITYIINRPILSAVISILIVILGILGLLILPVTQYPDIAPPTVTVAANYTGASAETVMESVVVPLEEAINGVEGMTYITSSASNNGAASIQVFFEQGIDPDIAAVNVQNRVSRTLPLLPSEVTRSGVTTLKARSGALMYLSFYSKNPNYDDTYIQNFLNINIIPAVKRIKGVGDANVFGGKDYAMRIWLKPDKMAAYQLEPNDVIQAINEQSREAAAGQLGQNSGGSYEYVIKYKGKYREEVEYENIIIRTTEDGQILYLRDVADIQLDALSYSGAGENRGYPAVSIGITQTPGSNAQEIIEEIKAYLEEARVGFPEGIDFTVNYDTNEFLDASIEKVLHTLVEAFILVFFVVFIFLQDFRSTLIPAIAVPVSIIGSFFFLNLFGFSLNLLTLFALVLAIGIVVDDAIVVVEAVHAKLEGGAKNAKKATTDAMHEIFGAIISITLVMAAVFIPVTFITGPVGIFYQQFGLTLIVAIMISAVNALTLSPVLCALFLKSNHHDEAYEQKSWAGKLFYKFNQGFQAATRRYAGLVKNMIKYKWIPALLFVLCLAILYISNTKMPKGFVPSEDRGIIFANMELPPGSSMERTYNEMKKLTGKVNQIEGVAGMAFSTGRSFFSGSGSNCALGFIRLEDFKERAKNEGQSVQEITQQLFALSPQIADAKVVFFSPASIPGYGNSAGFEVVLLDKSGGSISQLSEVAQQFVGELMKRPEISFAQTSFSVNYPQYLLELDVARAEMAGVSVNNILSTLQGYIGGVYAADFNKYGKQFRVMVQALPEDRSSETDLNEMYVRSGSGKMSPIAQFVSLDKVYGTQSINRFNLFTSVNITGSNAEGYSTGDAIAAVQEVAAQTLSTSYGIDYTGLTREEISSGSQTLLIFFLSFVFVYFILSAQYESFVIPLAVMLSLPFGVMGAYLGQWLMGLQNNIYFQIALIMLVGLLAKNAILIVEFAMQRRKNGESIPQAAINGAKARLRPILMTSFAFIFGMLPLVLATGIGAAGNQSIGTGAAFGLLIGTLVGLPIIPVLYTIFQWLHERVSLTKKIEE